MGKNHMDKSSDEANDLLDRFDMKINRADPRERVVSNFLRSFKGSREASKAVKQLLYQNATGLDWYTGRPLQTASASTPNPGSSSFIQEPETKKVSQILFNPDDLDALDDDLTSWGEKR
jgi:hypothetical protein